MLRNKTFQKTISALLVLMYAFVIFFSGKFHQHSEGFFSFSKLNKHQKIIVDGGHKTVSNDCMACHFLSSKTNIAPEQLTLSFFSNESAAVARDFSRPESCSTNFVYFNRRGPPLVS